MTTSRTIVVGYDGSPDATLALTWAAETARKGGCVVQTVVVASDMDPLIGDYHERGEHLAAEWRDRAAGELKELSLEQAEIGSGTDRSSPSFSRRQGMRRCWSSAAEGTGS